MLWNTWTENTIRDNYSSLSRIVFCCPIKKFKIEKGFFQFLSFQWCEWGCGGSPNCHCVLPKRWRYCAKIIEWPPQRSWDKRSPLSSELLTSDSGPTLGADTAQRSVSFASMVSRPFAPMVSRPLDEFEDSDSEDGKRRAVTNAGCPRPRKTSSNIERAKKLLEF